MTWTELCEKAKEIGGAVCSESEYEFEKIVFNNFLFYKNGRIAFDDTDEGGGCLIVHNIKSDATYEQMLAIIQALQ